MRYCTTIVANSFLPSFPDIERAYDSLTPSFKIATTVCLAGSSPECLEKLLSYGFTRDSVPVSFVGTWTWDGQHMGLKPNPIYLA